MKLRNPKNRFDLQINSKDRVLEIGGGHNPHPRANVIVDKYDDDNTHRSGNLYLGKGQEFIKADGESLPFEDKEFDYVICCHVLEHVPNPIKFLNEMIRVSKRGYIEIPSLMGEFLVPKYSHEWVCLEVENKLCVVRKSDIGMDKQVHNFGDLFLYYLNSFSFPYKVLTELYPNLLTVRIEWNQNLEFEINPEDEAYMSYFNKPWTYEMMQKQFPNDGLAKEFGKFLKASVNIGATYILNRFKGKKRDSVEKIGLQDTNPVVSE
ncbi:class I SAM-dependent methyltransferase [Sediminitomix flava]|uniref:Methyltransferase family protein n=1 Tax=Sediminitomix flava TaxID=379075 RepID=A0A315Z516_SEDFL|nr:class I SAM-dependent methyltransferase [Sediminitomix flava]PWJ38512.1 methyltransferase family protein [Sediminitomix flava]